MSITIRASNPSIDTTFPNQRPETQFIETASKSIRNRISETGGEMIKRSGILFFLIMILGVFWLNGEKVCDIDFIGKSPAFCLAKDRLLVWGREGVDIHAYDRNSGKFLYHFGQQGEGPGELRNLNSLFIKGEDLILQGGGKMIKTSLSGEMKYEKKQSGQDSFTIIKSLDGGFVAYHQNFYHLGRSKPDLGYQFQSVDDEFQPLATFYQGSMEGRVSFYQGDNPKRQKSNAFSEDVSIDGRGQKIVLGDSRYGQGNFTVFDIHGKELSRFNLEYQAIPVTKADKDHFIYLLKKNYGESNYQKEQQYTEYIFPDYFPAFYFFLLDDQNIYIFTYSLREGQQKVICTDYSGKIVRECWVDESLSKRGQFEKGWYYHLVEDPETESFSLHRNKI